MSNNKIKEKIDADNKKEAKNIEKNQKIIDKANNANKKIEKTKKVNEYIKELKEKIAEKNAIIIKLKKEIKEIKDVSNYKNCKLEDKGKYLCTRNLKHDGTRFKKGQVVDIILKKLIKKGYFIKIK